MKKKILAMTLALMMIGSLSSCGKSGDDKAEKSSAQTKSEQKSEEKESEAEEPKEPTVDQTLETYYFNVTLSVPAEEGADGTLTPKFVPIEYDEKEVSIVDCGLSNDSVAIEFSYISYTFQTDIRYQEKYGEVEANFENYVKYNMDEKFANPFATGIELTTLGDYEAFKYVYGGKVIYSLNVEELPANFMVFVRPLDENAEPEEALNDPDVVAAIESVKVHANEN
ncbi:MAG: hypothetical protein ACI4JW_06960 [Oscillospiraceae bacterium]